jgi:hypothetical protein
LEQFQHMIKKNKKYHTVGTVQTYDRKKQKYHSVGTVPTYDRNKQKKHSVGTVPTYDRNKYHMLELLQQCVILCLFLSYVGNVTTVWYFMFISIICWNCYNSVVFFVFISSICCYKTLIQ